MNRSKLPSQGFPATRMRRNRKAAWSRALIAENTLQSSDLIWPMFVIDGENTRVLLRQWGRTVQR
jgi:porphobilinogen synthase